MTKEKREDLATILAALRFFQKAYQDKDADSIRRDWPEHFNGIEPLGTEDIDALCDRLNTPDNTERVSVPTGETPPLERYKHRCVRCAVLGRYAEYDLYFCSLGGRKTVIARYGSAPSEYLSGIGFTLTPLVIAEALAHRKGLL